MKLIRKYDDHHHQLKKDLPKNKLSILAFKSGRGRCGEQELREGFTLSILFELFTRRRQAFLYGIINKWRRLKFKQAVKIFRTFKEGNEQHIGLLGHIFREKSYIVKSIIKHIQYNLASLFMNEQKRTHMYDRFFSVIIQIFINMFI